MIFGLVEGILFLFKLLEAFLDHQFPTHKVAFNFLTISPMACDYCAIPASMRYLSKVTPHLYGH